MAPRRLSIQTKRGDVAEQHSCRTRLGRANMTEAPSTRPSLLIRLRDFQDRQAWHEFVDRYAPGVFGYVRSRGLQNVDAADLTQEVLSLLCAPNSGGHARPLSGLRWQTNGPSGSKELAEASNQAAFRLFFPGDLHRPPPGSLAE